ncbi:hypothetical protein ASZ90_009136 [hydrocarbon metagenome]|uniref:Uncharacterized protein n=1 Tax=hydrocarbon metagenome TaxID=938273 RepID=A0A0W8FLC0_9ZZZZ
MRAMHAASGIPEGLLPQTRRVNCAVPTRWRGDRHRMILPSEVPVPDPHRR